MDYSLLLAIHNLEKEQNNSAIEAYYDAKLNEPPPTTEPVTPSTSHKRNSTKAFNL